MSKKGEKKNSENLATTTTSTKKRTGLISSLYNSAVNLKQITTEEDLIHKYENKIPIRPEDVLKLNSYTESELIF